MEQKYYWHSYYCENSLALLGSNFKILENVTKVHPFVKMRRLNEDWPEDKKEYTLMSFREITPEEYDLFKSK